jgi:hypothetical protein
MYTFKINYKNGDFLNIMTDEIDLIFIYLEANKREIEEVIIKKVEV